MDIMLELRLELPHGTQTIGFAQDIALVVIRKQLLVGSIVANEPYRFLPAATSVSLILES